MSCTCHMIPGSHSCPECTEKTERRAAGEQQFRQLQRIENKLDQVLQILGAKT